MTQEAVIQIARRYLQQELKLRPVLFEVKVAGEDENDKIIEFKTEKGHAIEVCIRPRHGQIISRTVQADGIPRFHMAEFAILSVTDVFRKIIADATSDKVD